MHLVSSPLTKIPNNIVYFEHLLKITNERCTTKNAASMISGQERFQELIPAICNNKSLDDTRIYHQVF